MSNKAHVRIVYAERLQLDRLSLWQVLVRRRLSVVPDSLGSDGWGCHGNAQEKVSQLQDLLRKYMLRRVKEDVQKSIGMSWNEVMVTSGPYQLFYQLRLAWIFYLIQWMRNCEHILLIWFVI
jgi:hypothetical protein